MSYVLPLMHAPYLIRCDLNPDSIHSQSSEVKSWRREARYAIRD